MELSRIKRCFELTDRDVAAAVQTRAGARALIDHMASIAKPNQGAPKILLLFARMATTACDWLDGYLRVEIVGDKDVTVIEVLTELGDGLRERALPSFSINVPVVEFVRAVERVPKMVEPLAVKAKGDKRLVLVAVVDPRGRTMPPPPVEIAEEHLSVRGEGRGNGS